jgi:uncharacterized membrane protein YfcA
MDKSNLGIFLIAFAIVLLVVAGRIDWLAILLPCGIVVLFIGARSSAWSVRVPPDAKKR